MKGPWFFNHPFRRPDFWGGIGGVGPSESPWLDQIWSKNMTAVSCLVSIFVLTVFCSEVTCTRLSQVCSDLEKSFTNQPWYNQCTINWHSNFFSMIFHYFLHTIKPSCHHHYRSCLVPPSSKTCQLMVKRPLFWLKRLKPEAWPSLSPTARKKWKEKTFIPNLPKKKCSIECISRITPFK